MSVSRAILPALLSFILIAIASADQPAFTPQTGVLVLRNGQVLQGDITRAGDYFVVMLGPASEIRLRADEVDVACRNLDEAYVHRLQRLDPTAHTQRMVLAEWCLRNGLLDQAEEQLELASVQAGDNPQIKSLLERLKFAREPRREFTGPKSAMNLATVGADQLDKELRGLPDGSIEKFSAVVQPILLNSCAANHCHGPMSKNGYQLLKPAIGQVANQRYSQRNLYSTMRFVDHNDPLGSPLLVMPQRRHGGAAGPIFDERTRSQLEELSAWVQMITAPKAAAKSLEKIDPSSSLLTAGHRPQTNGASAPPASPAEEPNAVGRSASPNSEAKSPSSLPTESVTVPQSSPFVPRDAFDPEIFNRRFFGKK